MVASEHCQAQDKGFGGARNTLTGIGMVMLSFFSFYRYLYYRTYDRFLLDDAKG